MTKPRLHGEITIEQVLSDMKGRRSTFWLCFVRGTGKKRGTFKVVGKCRYGAPQPNSPSSGDGGSGRKKSLHVDNGTLPITDSDTDEYLTPYISHMVGYQGKRIIHSNETKE